MGRVTAASRTSRRRHWAGVFLLLAGIWLACPAGAAPPTKSWEAMGHIPGQQVKECSGIVASRQHPGIFWVHNDSGNLPYLYAIKLDGTVVAEVPVLGVTNIDWEDIAADDHGSLYVGDIGNNWCMFPVRSVYQLAEPDPYAEPMSPIRVTVRHKYSYEGERFDAEGLFVTGGRIYIVSKPRGGRSAVYRLDRDSEDQEVVRRSDDADTSPAVERRYHAVKLSDLSLAGATAADYSEDRHELAVANPWAVALLPVVPGEPPAFQNQHERARFPADEFEACCFDGEDLILVTEPGSIYRIDRKDLEQGIRFVKTRTSPGAADE